MTTRTLVNTIAISFGISFLDGMLGWGINESTTIFLGLVDVVAIIWLVIKVNK